MSMLGLVRNRNNTITWPDFACEIVMTSSSTQSVDSGFFAIWLCYHGVIINSKLQ